MLVLILSMLSACGSETTGVFVTDEGIGRSGANSAPAYLGKISGDGQSAQVGQGFETPLVVQVKDGSGRAVEGISVRWAVMKGGGMVATSVTVTDAAGMASQRTWTAGTAAGTNEIAASVTGVETATFAAVGTPGPPASATVTPPSLAIQQGKTTHLTAHAWDAYGNILSAPSCAWRTSDASIASVDASGLVRGLAPGTVTLIAEFGGVTATATLTVQAEAIDHLKKISGDGQTGTVGAVLSQPLRIRVLDAFGAPRPGLAVVWTVTAGGGSLSPDAGVSDADGYAHTIWTLGTRAGGNAAAAAVEDAEIASFNAIAVAGPVAAVAVSPSNAFVQAEQQQQQFTARAQDQYGNVVGGATFSWSSSEAGVATINSSGLASGVATGMATITAEASGISGTASLTVQLEPVNVLQKAGGDGQNGTVGSTLAQPLRIRVVDGAGTPIQGRSVTWAVAAGGGSLSPSAGLTDGDGYAQTTWTLGTVTGENAALATVSGAGELTFVADASAGAFKAVTLVPASATISKGQTRQFSARAQDQFGNVLGGVSFSWGSSNNGIATVSSSGLVTGVGSGSAEIRATAFEVTGSATVAVTAESQVTNPGTVGDLRVLGVSANTVTLRWTEVDGGTGSPAKYDVRYAATPLGWGWGQATVVTQGTCATPVQGQAIGQPLTCTVEGLSSSFSYDFQLVAYRGTMGVDVVFGGLSNIATGVTSAPSGGEGTLAPVASVTVSPSSTTIQLGGTQQLTVTLRDAGGSVLTGRTVTWTSSNPGMVPVSGTGLVSGQVAGGPVTITATSEGKTGTSAVTVSANAIQVASVTATPSSVSLTGLGKTSQLTAIARDASGTVVSGATFSWRSLNPSIISVNNSGLVTSQAIGTALIVASATCCTAADTVTVYASNPTGSATTWFEEDWAYSSTAAMKSAVDYVYESNGSVSLVTGLTGTPWGGSNAIQCHSNGGYATVGVNLQPPRGGSDQPREVWLEAYIKFDGNWRVVSVPQQQADHKTMFYVGPNGSNRSDVHVGESGKVSVYPGSGWLGVQDDLVNNWWNGTWIRVRWHRKMSTNGKGGIIEFWRGGTLLISAYDIDTGSQASDYHSMIALGRNGGIQTAASFYWGRVRVFTTDPGW